MTATSRGRPRRSQSKLSKTQIVETATCIGRSEGLAACSFRRLAAELGVTAMAVSYHVSTRRELLLSMIDFAFADLNKPLEAPSPKARLRELVLRYLKTGTQQAHLVQAALQDPTLMTSQLEPFTEQLRKETRALNAGDPHDVLLNLLVDYAHGHIFAVAAATDGDGPDLEVFQRGLDWVLSNLDG